MHHYIALIHKEADSDYGVSFPDLPGVITAGTTLDEARTMAEEALAFHIEGLMADGEAIPEPSRLEDIMADRKNREAVAALIPAKTEAPRAVRVNITLPADVLQQIDRYAKMHGLSRSSFLAKAAKAKMERDTA